nr:jasmonate ZIM-domain 1 variant 3 [Camellia sinensis var. sinensis]
MERDFLGLNSKDSVVVVKEEAVEGCKDSAFSKGSGVQWPLSNKVSALPHFMSFKVAQDEMKPKVMSDPLAASGFMSISTADAFDTTRKHRSGETQNFAGATMKQQLLGGIPVTAPHPMISSLASVAGTTEPWLNSKSSEAPPQLTIFYAGTVNVYNDISPEKAQAIMFLAGNGASNKAQPRAQVQVPTSKQTGGDGVLGNQPTINTPPNSGLSSPISVSSHPVGQSGNGLTANGEMMAAKPNGVSTTPLSKIDPPKIGPLAANTMIPSGMAL